MGRYEWLEAQLDRDDLTEEEFDKYNKELNDLHEQRSNAKAKAKAMAIREQQRQEEQEELALAKVLALTEEQVDKMYMDSCLKYQDVNGMSFKDWYAQSLKFYTIDEQFNVHAKARSPKDEFVEIIPHLTFAQAKLTILTRIKYKFYDHAVRGRDFKHTDV